MRKALCVGIDSYKNIKGLHGCVNDAKAVKEVLERNGDDTLNFNVKLMCSISEESYISKTELKDAIEELFKSESEIALFYYSGHGSIDPTGGYLCTSEVKRADEGLSLNDIMLFASQSKAQNKIIILDSCFCGNMGNKIEMSNYSLLHDGTTILAACEKDQYATEKDGHGVYTSLLVEALYGGAMNLLGEVSPGSIYAYIDKSLGAWEQRPVFKANVNSFISLRKNTPPISITDLRKIIVFFPTPQDEYKLDPSYEPDKHEVKIKDKNEEHEAIFAILQKYARLNLVIPIGEEHMYYAAIRSKTCKLTACGQHYWNLVKKNTI
ncbi:MAG: caspase family protein [Helicobacter sp.]|nr:caspase family protein [Helicobacter sp.]